MFINHLIINDLNKGNDVQMFRKYEEKYQKLFKNVKRFGQNIIILQEELSESEMSYLCEQLYKNIHKDIVLGVYDSSFLKENSEIIEKYHLDVRELINKESLKPHRPYVKH